MWTQIGQSLNGDDNGDKFGISVAISDKNNYIVTGASGIGTDKGGGYVYYLQHGQITIKGLGKMTIKGLGKITVK